MIEGLPEQLTSFLSSRYGLPLMVSPPVTGRTQTIKLQPTDFHPNESFKLAITVGWRTLNFEFVPGSYSATLLHQMGNADEDHKNGFVVLSTEAKKLGATIKFKVNDYPLSPFSFDEWLEDWNQLSLTMKSPFIEVEEDLSESEELIEYLKHWTGIFWGMVIALLPLTVQDDALAYVDGQTEGTPHEVMSIRYERSRVNRLVCITMKGVNCTICKMSFEETYGLVGRNFIHVHHQIPVSQIGPDYRVNPATDLIPVCPNCHAMLHRRNPPFTPDEIRQLLS